MALLITRLRKWRNEEDFTLEEVSGLTGVSVTMLSRAERGERHLSPRLRVLIARRLGVPLSTLFEVEPVPDDDGSEAAVAMRR
jgi:transcriptional regulator with XRE-family HTH domain